jgi:hypothetical protein
MCTLDDDAPPPMPLPTHTHPRTYTQARTHTRTHLCGDGEVAWWVLQRLALNFDQLHGSEQDRKEQPAHGAAECFRRRAPPHWQRSEFRRATAMPIVVAVAAGTNTVADAGDAATSSRTVTVCFLVQLDEQVRAELVEVTLEPESRSRRHEGRPETRHEAAI